MKKLESLILYGCGGHARSMADVAFTNGVEKLIFVDENARPQEKLFGFDVISSLSELGSGTKAGDYPNIILAIGQNEQRAKIFNSLLNMNDMKEKKVVSLIANNAHIGKDVRIEKGVFVGSGAHIGPNAQIGENTIINTHCVIEHDCQIGKHSHISVNATVAGRCRVGDFSMIGAGATVIDGVSITDSVIVGAGAVVVKDITEPGIYVGVPARKISLQKN